MGVVFFTYYILGGLMKYIKYIFIVIIILVSFYVTEQSALFLRSKDPIMQTIKEYSKDYNTDSVDAIIDDNYITPGLYGKRVNEIKSLMKMKSLKTFNSIFLKTDFIKPNISIEDNKDKIINKGNEKKNSISLVLESDISNIISYLNNEKIDVSILVNNASINNTEFEQINNDFDNYDKVEKILNKSKTNTNICLLNRNNKNYCIRHKKYLVEPTYILTSSNLVMIKNNITSGSIILVKDNVSIDDLSYLINYIRSKNLKIVKLSELISER